MHASVERYQDVYRKNILQLMETFEENIAGMLEGSINYWLNTSMQFAKIMASAAQSWFKFLSEYWAATKRLASGNYIEPGRA